MNRCKKIKKIKKYINYLMHINRKILQPNINKHLTVCEKDNLRGSSNYFNYIK